MINQWYQWSHSNTICANVASVLGTLLVIWSVWIESHKIKKNSPTNTVWSQYTVRKHMHTRWTEIRGYKSTGLEIPQELVQMCFEHCHAYIIYTTQTVKKYTCANHGSTKYQRERKQVGWVWLLEEMWKKKKKEEDLVCGNLWCTVSNRLGLMREEINVFGLERWVKRKQSKPCGLRCFVK